MIQLAIALAIITLKLVKWTLIKTRLFVVVIPISIVLIFFMAWYGANTLLADIIGIALVVIVAVSWIMTLVKNIEARKKNKELVLDWAYERYGTPRVLTKKSL